MNKVKDNDVDELRPEYQRSDFDKLVRGKYAERLAEETNVVVLEPDIAKAFPNEKVVNDALRGLLKIMEATRFPEVSNSSLE